MCNERNVYVWCVQLSFYNEIELKPKSKEQSKPELNENSWKLISFIES